MGEDAGEEGKGGKGVLASTGLLNEGEMDHDEGEEGEGVGSACISTDCEREVMGLTRQPRP